MSKPLEIVLLERARAKLAKPTAWTKDFMAKTALRSEVSFTHSKATQFCMLGALYRAAYEIDHNAVNGIRANFHPAVLEAERRLARSIDDKPLPPGWDAADGRISYFNDHEATTHEDVLRVYDEAIATTKGQAHGRSKTEEKAKPKARSKAREKVFA
jgi:hypothetical protein